jgi:hypothetical protein
MKPGSIISLLAAVLLASSFTCEAQQQRDTTFALELTLGGGYARYIMPYDTRFGIDRSGAAASARLSWLPDHRLRVGVETGWTRFYSYDLRDVETSFGTTDASLSLSAVPLLLVFSMPVAGSLQLHAGTGGYYVRSHATSFGSTTDVYAFSQGWMGAASYTAVVWSGYRLGMELTWYGATEFGDGVVLLQLKGSFEIIRW